MLAEARTVANWVTVPAVRVVVATPLALVVPVVEESVPPFVLKATVAPGIGWPLVSSTVALSTVLVLTRILELAAAKVTVPTTAALSLTVIVAVLAAPVLATALTMSVVPVVAPAV